MYTISHQKGSDRDTELMYNIELFLGVVISVEGSSPETMFELVKSYVQDAAAEQISVTNPLTSGTSPWLKSARSGDRTLQHTPSMRDYYQMSRSSSSQEQLVPPSPGDEGQPGKLCCIRFSYVGGRYQGLGYQQLGCSTEDL